jgi:hypothetical protein
VKDIVTAKQKKQFQKTVSYGILYLKISEEDVHGFTGDTVQYRQLNCNRNNRTG